MARSNGSPDARAPTHVATASAPSATVGRDALSRLTAVGSRHHRATDDPSGVRLWFRDPNGTDVAIRLPFDADPNNRPGQEIDPDHIVTRLYAVADGE